MDIRTLEVAAVEQICGDVACGQCSSCHRKAMLMAASYVERNTKKDAPQGVLLDLLEHLGLPG